MFSRSASKSHNSDTSDGSDFDEENVSTKENLSLKDINYCYIIKLTHNKLSKRVSLIYRHFLIILAQGTETIF